MPTVFPALILLLNPIEETKRSIIRLNVYSRAPATWKNTSLEEYDDDDSNGIINVKGGETKRMKLKIGGVTRLVHANVSSPRVNDTNHLEVPYPTFDVNAIKLFELSLIHSILIIIFFVNCYPKRPLRLSRKDNVFKDGIEM